MIRCYLLSQRHAAPVSLHPVVAPHPLVTAHLTYRRKRRIRRAIAIVCVSVGAIGAAAAIPVSLSPSPQLSSPAPAGSGNSRPESQWVPETAAGDTQSIPEPSTLSLLLPAAMAALMWRIQHD